LPIYLYIKTHNKTGLKYLGQTKSKDPHRYKGSGSYWLDHLKVHGNDYTTDILHECDSKKEIKRLGTYYSNLWDIVEARDELGKKLWANLKPETGDGVDSISATRENLRRVESGTHPWVGGEVARKSNQKRIENGTHPFLGGELQSKTNQKRIADGTHLFLNGDYKLQNNLKRVANGTHNLLGGDVVRKQLENGTHPSQIKVTCPYCNKTGSRCNMKRWHFENCKLKRVNQDQIF